jgi:hypothetical protein
MGIVLMVLQFVSGKHVFVLISGWGTSGNENKEDGQANAIRASIAEL